MRNPLDIIDFENEDDYSIYLKELTGFNYDFAISSHRKLSENSPVETGEFYQLMPTTKDDGFFDWYCDNRMYHQFFASQWAATLQFIKYWFQWQASKK